MKIFPAIILCLLLNVNAHAQRISLAEFQSLQKNEDSLKEFAWKIITGMNSIDRLNADSIFTKKFVRALKTNNSFYYSFDSLQTISQLYAPDSSFKIFTWQLQVNEKVVRQHGAIQMRTNDGSLKIIPLIDKSDVTVNMEDTIANNRGWMGAVYYKIVQTSYAGKNFYTLIGFDAGSISVDRKIIEVMTFENGEPVFGGHYFSVPDDKLIPKSHARYIMYFKKDAGPRLNYDNDLQMIIAEHLISESNQPQKRYTLVGDGDYQGFKWMNGKWVYVEKVFAQSTPEGQPPVPVPAEQRSTVTPYEHDEAAPKKGVKKKDSCNV